MSEKFTQKSNDLEDLQKMVENVESKNDLSQEEQHIKDMPDYVRSDLQKSIIEKQKAKNQLKEDEEQILKNLENRKKLGLENSIEKKVESVVEEIESEKQEPRIIAEKGSPETKLVAQEILSNATAQQKRIQNQLISIEIIEDQLKNATSGIEKKRLEAELEKRQAHLGKLNKDSIDTKDTVSSGAIELGEGKVVYTNESGNPITKAEHDALQGKTETTKDQMERLAKEKDEEAKINRMMSGEYESGDASEKSTSNLENTPATEQQIPEVESILKSIAWLEGKNKDHSTNSTVAREKRKMRDLIKSGKISALEAEILMEDAKKGNIEKNLGIFAGRINEKTRNYKARKWFGQYTSWMNKGPRWARVAKRIGSSALIGGAMGAAGIGAAAALGVGAVGGAAIGLGRLAASATAGGLAGTIHRGLTRKKLKESVGKYTDMYKDESKDKLSKELFIKHDDSVLNARDRGLLKTLRKEKLDGIISKENSVILETLEVKRKEQAHNLMITRKNYAELVHRKRSKNERNNMLWSGAAGLAVGFGSSYAIPHLDPDLIPGSTNPEVVPINPDTTPVAPGIEDTTRISVETGDGYTHMLKKAFSDNPELFKDFNVGDSMSNTESFEVAKKLGIVDAQGNLMREFRLYDTGGSIEFVKEDGGLTLREYNSKGEYLGCFNENEGYFDATGRKTDINYLENTAKAVERTDINPEITHVERVTNDITHVERVIERTDINPEITHTERVNPTPIEDNEYVNTTETTVDDTLEKHNNHDHISKDLNRAQIKAMYQNGEFGDPNSEQAKEIFRQMKRNHLRGGKTWLGNNKGWLAGAAILGADAIEDGKIDLFGIFDGKGGGTPPVIDGTPDEGWGGNGTGGNESGGSTNSGGFGGNGAGGNLRANMNSYVNRLNSKFK